MFTHPAAPSRAGRSSATSRVALSRRGSLILAAFTSMAATALPAGAQSAADILKRVDSAYTKATTYQGSLIIKQSGKGPDGKPASVTQTQQIKYKGPNLVHVVVTATGTGSAKAQASRASSTVVSDGKTFFVYNTAMKQYMKRPAPPTFPLRQLLATVIPAANTPGLKLLAPTTVGGRPAFVLELKQPMPPNLTPEQKAQFAKIRPAKIMVDKQTYQVLKIVRSSPDGSLDITLNGQSFKASFPASTFAFTPPAGAKEFVPPANPQGAPGAPGLPGGAPPPGPGR